MKFAHELVSMQRSRLRDAHGSGQFGASRGHRAHHGLDIVAPAGAEVFSPIDGELVREALPYGDDQRYRGVLLRGSADWKGLELRIYYTEGLLSGNVKAGMVIGRAQNLTLKYPGITNHIHLEARWHGILIPPADLYGMCF